jgi:hypothetical protein
MGDDFTPPPGVKRKSEKKASGRRPASGKRFLHFGEKVAGWRPARRTRAFLPMISAFVNQKGKKNCEEKPLALPNCHSIF